MPISLNEQQRKLYLRLSNLHAAYNAERDPEKKKAIAMDVNHLRTLIDADRRQTPDAKEVIRK